MVQFSLTKNIWRRRSWHVLLTERLRDTAKTFNVDGLAKSPSTRPGREELPISIIEGKTTGLKPDQIRRIERLGRMKPAPGEIIPVEMARRLSALSREIKRQLGLLIDRRGSVNFILIGDRRGVYIPDLSRYRFSPGHLRGLRLIHTHLEPAGLSREDLADLTLVRLDLIVAIEVTLEGIPSTTHLGYLMKSASSRWTMETYPGPHALPGDPLALISMAEGDLRKHITGRITDGASRAILVALAGSSFSRAEESMDELGELARTAGIVVARTVIQPRSRPDPRYVIGRGKLDDAAVLALDTGADTLVFNSELSPSQLLAIADITELKVIDRTMLILDIFAQHARSRGGKIQVELAQLRYLLPRLSGKGTALSRLAGGIGTRGPGETKLEVDRRRIRQRISKLQISLARLQKNRQVSRSRRGRDKIPIVSIVGYTNVGKSTLLNTLTRSSEIAENKLFATLDPVSRRLSFPDGTTCILTDTVGLIHDLPPELERAFSATFEEIRDADLILHLADASHAQCEEQIRTVERTIEGMELCSMPQLLVLNKSDLVDDETLVNMGKRHDALSVCALDRDTLQPLMEKLATRITALRRPTAPDTNP